MKTLTVNEVRQRLAQWGVTYHANGTGNVRMSLGLDLQTVFTRPIGSIREQIIQDAWLVLEPGEILDEKG